MSPSISPTVMTEPDGIQKVLDSIIDKPVYADVVCATPIQLLVNAGKTEDEARAILHLPR